ncbi:MAG TPA: hypothetical protein VF432_13700 [Thermoanaerobaculia bacterium]
MPTRIAAVLLLLFLGVLALQAQVEPSPPSEPAEESVDSSETVETSTTTVTTTTSISTTAVQTPPPGWTHLVRIAALAGPIAFLLLAWTAGAAVHYRLVRREHEQFPMTRGSRTPQTMPMILSAGLFFVPAVLFVVFEVRSRMEIRQGIGGVVDEWQPVTAQAWVGLVVCLVLALLPWLFARRADTVS